MVYLNYYGERCVCHLALALRFYWSIILGRKNHDNNDMYIYIKVCNTLTATFGDPTRNYDRTIARLQSNAYVDKYLSARLCIPISQAHTSGRRLSHAPRSFNYLSIRFHEHPVVRSKYTLNMRGQWNDKIKILQ